MVAGRTYRFCLAVLLTASLVSAGCKESSPEQGRGGNRGYSGPRGCINGNCTDGRGIFVENDGERYEGEWKARKRHGIGTAFWPDGSSYIGQWEFDLAGGKGIYFKNTGEKYEGDWKEGKRQGKGKSTWPDGSVYSGDFNNDMAEGIGEFKDANGVIYKGEFRNGKAHGIGTLITTDGKSYRRKWDSGKPVPAK